MATYNAGSVSYAAVSGAVASGANGDTIIVPTGNAFWTQALVPNKAITLLGAGSGLTNISGHGINLINWSSPVDQPIRLSGFSFYETGYGGNSIGAIDGLVRIVGLGQIGGQSILTQVRVDHCSFTYGTRSLSTQGYCYGVADHNAFINNNIAWGPFGDNTSGWLRPFILGGSGAFFFENNQVTVKNPTPVGTNESVYLSEGCRAVVRYNVFNWSGYTNDASSVFDSHGNYNITTGNDPLSARGQPTYEFYNNTIYLDTFYRMMYLRGGLNVVHDNTIFYNSGSVGAVFELSEEDGWQTLVSNPLMTIWPGRDQPQLFQWNNTLNDSNISAVIKNVSPGSDDIFIVSGRDWFDRPPASGDTYLAFISGYVGSGYLTFNMTGYAPFVYPYPFSNSGNDNPSIVYKRLGKYLRLYGPST